MATNVDASELAKFNRDASSWWDLDGPSKALHDINPLRMQFIKQHVTLQDAVILDVGCGGGILTESLAKAGAASVTGIDLAKDALQTAKLHALEQDLNIRYQCIAAEAHAVEHPEQYDVITCLELLEHVPAPLSIITACASMLKPGGKIFFSTINRNPKSFLQAIVGAEYVLRLVPKGTHAYEKFIKPNELTHWCRGQGLAPISFQGLHYHPLNKEYYLRDNIAVNYLLVAEKTI